MQIPIGLFRALLPLTALATRTPGRAWLGRPFMRAMGLTTLWIRRGRPQSGAEEVGAEWHRMFPKHINMPITRVEGDTVYAEIHEVCPHRGTGNVEGCWRMMEYDRRMLERIGGQLVVLHSQSEPGRSHCELAIRPVGQPIDDLEHAHERVRRLTVLNE